MDKTSFQSLVDLSVREASVIKETANDTHKYTYIGYAKAGTKTTDEPTFSINRRMLETATNITTSMWAEGSLDRKFAFKDCETLNYEFLR